MQMERSETFVLGLPRPSEPTQSNLSGPTQRENASDREERAWAAGFFDGEGWVGRNGRGSRSIRITLSQVDRVALDRFCSAVGAGKVCGPFADRVNLRKSPGARPYWVFRASSRADVLQVQERLREWLSPAKRDQFDRAFALMGPDFSKICRKCGRVKDEKRTDSKSLRCSTCRRERQRKPSV